LIYQVLRDKRLSGDNGFFFAPLHRKDNCCFTLTRNEPTSLVFVERILLALMGAGGNDDGGDGAALAYYKTKNSNSSWLQQQQQLQQQQRLAAIITPTAIITATAVAAVAAATPVVNTRSWNSENSGSNSWSDMGQSTAVRYQTSRQWSLQQRSL
jgi:hypothetical protein